MSASTSYTFRHLDNVAGIGGIARLPDIDGRAVLVLYAVDAPREPDRQLVFNGLDQAWIEPGKPFVAFEIPRGWPDRASLQRLVPDLAPGKPLWRCEPATRAEAHAVVEGLRAIGFFDPDHPEAGGRRASADGRRGSPIRRRDNVVALRAAPAGTASA